VSARKAVSPAFVSKSQRVRNIPRRADPVVPVRQRQQNLSFFVCRRGTILWTALDLGEDYCDSAESEDVPGKPSRTLRPFSWCPWEQIRTS
jgi:hypothetical protein